MPLYMDRHYVEGATQHAVAQAHEKDLAIQNKYNVKFLTYWFDEARCTAFCLMEAPNKESITKAHAEAHGLVPNEILPVDPTLVEAFLGRITDPVAIDSVPETTGKVGVDAAFRAVMFTDLKDSTQMTTTLGDEKALHLLHIHNAIIRNSLREHQHLGREVKHTGDGIMASFVSIMDAVQCAISIQRGFAAHNRQNPTTVLHLKIGLSAGEPIEEHGDLFGTVVQLAARLCARAEPGQILVAQVVRDQCQGAGLSLIDAGEFTPKGFDHPIRTHEVRWR